MAARLLRARPFLLAVRPVRPVALNGPRFPRHARSTSQDAAVIIPDKVTPEHAVISVFDLFSIGVGPSSSHTVGPMRAAAIFVNDLVDLGLLEKVVKCKITLHGSLAATGKGHMTPQAIVLGMEGSDPETIETTTMGSRYDAIVNEKKLTMGGTHLINFDMDKDMIWRLEQLPQHPNGMRFSCFDAAGEMICTNEYYSVGGGFVVNEQTSVNENLYYRSIRKDEVAPARLSQTHGLEGEGPKLLPAGSEDSNTEPSTGKPAEGAKPTAPPFLFRTGNDLLALTRKHNLTIAQLVWNNELHYLSPDEISEGLIKIWSVMDGCIRDGVHSTEELLPGDLRVRRRARGLYRRLFKGFFPSVPPAEKHASLPGATSQTPMLEGPSDSSFVSTAPKKASKKSARMMVGQFDHDLPVVPWKNTVLPGIDFLSCYAIAVNEVNAAGGRVVTAPTNGAAGVIPAVLKYTLEFVSDDPDRDVKNFLLTAGAVGMLYKRGASISAADGGCMSEVGVASSMAAAGLTACLGGSPAQALQAAETAIEHSLGMTCDPVQGLVQIPCIERNSLGAVKAVTAAQLAMAGNGEHSVSLDEAIEAMRQTALAMHSDYKETSVGGLANTVRIPLSSPAC